MRVSKVAYGRLVNTGEYSHEKYDVEVILEDGESPEEALNKAKRLVDRQINRPTDAERQIAKSVSVFDEDIPF